MITFPAAQLSAIAHACATAGDLREHLRNVRIQRDERGAFLIASDGNMLAVRRVGDGGAPFDAAIPPGHVKGAGKRGDIVVDTKTATMSCGPVTLRLETDHAEIGQYPDWRRVIPASASLKPAKGPGLFDQFLLARAVKALEPDIAYLRPAVRGNGIELHHGETPTSAGVLVPVPTEENPDPGVFVVIMPMHYAPGRENWARPAWL